MTVLIAGEPRTLKYGFRAFKELGVNPFKPQSLIEMLANLDIESAVAFLRAGLLHEYYGTVAPRKGEEPPTVEQLIDDVDMESFINSLREDMGKIAGGDGVKSSEAAPADPPLA
jgi:hypothetical protein